MQNSILSKTAGIQRHLQVVVFCVLSLIDMIELSFVIKKLIYLQYFDIDRPIDFQLYGWSPTWPAK